MARNSTKTIGFFDFGIYTCAMAYSIDQQTSYFLKQRGLTLDDLKGHPQWDDISLLVRVKEDFGYDFNKSEASVWGAYWSIVYKWKKSLKKKHLDKLYMMVENISTRKAHIKAQILKHRKS